MKIYVAAREGVMSRDIISVRTGFAIAKNDARVRSGSPRQPAESYCYDGDGYHDFPVFEADTIAGTVKCVGRWTTPSGVGRTGGAYEWRDQGESGPLAGTPERG